MANIKLTAFLATILIAIFILDSFPVISASLSPGAERFDSSWFCGGKSRKMHSDCWKRLTDFKVPALDGERLRAAAAAPPPPQHSRSPPRK